jgi:hypothetical protein
MVTLNVNKFFYDGYYLCIFIYLCIVIKFMMPNNVFIFNLQNLDLTDLSIAIHYSRNY